VLCLRWQFINTKNIPEEYSWRTEVVLTWFVERI